MNRESIALVVVVVMLVATIVGIILSHKRWRLLEKDDLDLSLFEIGYVLGSSLIAITLTFAVAVCFDQWLQTIPSGVVNR